MATTQNFPQLLSFFRNPDNKCFWNEDDVEVISSELGGTGVFATRDLSADDEEDALILRIHKESILSYRNSCISNLLHELDIRGIHAMILAFIYERSMGESSPWYDYINSINIFDTDGQLILPPFLWPEEEQSLLKGTEAEILGALDPTESQEFFALSIQFAKDIANIFPIPFELSANVKDTQDENMAKYHQFVALCAAISSRAFAIDQYHEIALVPGADLFNHNCYHQENVHFETVNDVCPFCGDPDECGHLQYGPPDSEEEQEGEDASEAEWEEMSVDDEEEVDEDEEIEEEGEEEEEDEVPVTEITTEYIEKMEMELEEEAREAEQEEGDEEDDKENEEEGGDSEDDEEEGNMSDTELILIPDECVDIVLQCDVKAGQEIFNTYGDLSNSVLIARYGFTAASNPNDYVGLGRQAIKFAKANKQLSKHFKFWEEKGFQMAQEFLKLKEKATREEHGGGCCEGDDHDHDHGHEHEHEHEHDEEGGCCGTEDEEEEDEDEFEDSWELELKITSDGEPSPCTYALANFLTLSASDLKKVAKIEDPEELLPLMEQLFEDENSKAFEIICNWCKERSMLYNDGGMTSEDYSKLIAKQNSDPHKKFISLLIQSEKQIIEKSMTLFNSKI